MCLYIWHFGLLDPISSQIRRSSHIDRNSRKENRCGGFKIFTTRRYASTVYEVVVCLSVRLSVCVCVCVSVTPGIKTAKPRITQTTPHDNPKTQSFCDQTFPRNLNWVIPKEGANLAVGYVKIGDFKQITIAVTRKWYMTDACGLPRMTANPQNNRNFYILRVLSYLHSE